MKFNIDAILETDEYYDLILVDSSNEKNVVNTISFENEKTVTVCQYYGSKPIEQLTIPLNTLENCTFLDLINE